MPDALVAGAAASAQNGSAPKKVSSSAASIGESIYTRADGYCPVHVRTAGSIRFGTC